MNWRSFVVLSALMLVVLVAVPSFPQDQASPARGRVVLPPSSIPTPGMPHTPLLVFIPEGRLQPSTPAGETPASIACLYGVTQQVAGCPKSGTILPTGGSRAIAVIEYGKNSSMVSDLNNFSTTFGLPPANVTEVCVEASCPSNNGTGWDLETALDVQWAHAMAPQAQLFVVESGIDLFAAVQKANQLVSAAGGGEISNSWVTSIGGEPGNETQLDQNQTPGIVYFAAAGDWGLGALYPSASPYVVSAGGTTIQRDGSGNYTGEKCWSDSGGGISRFEVRPTYQHIIGNIANARRGTPDWAADADPASGVAVYSSSYCGGWCRVGGTSASSPILAAIVNQLGNFMNSTNDELTKTYNEYTNPAQYHRYFTDILTGSNGAPATFGWDTCTGLGVPKNPQGL